MGETHGQETKIPPTPEGSNLDPCGAGQESRWCGSPWLARHGLHDLTRCAGWLPTALILAPMPLIPDPWPLTLLRDSTRT